MSHVPTNVPDLGNPQTGPTAQFDPAAAHHQRPRLRPVRGFPAQVSGQTMLGLADARQISDKMVVLPMAAQQLLPLLNGERTVEEIVTQVGKGLTAPILHGLIAQLDDAGLLFGPRFDAILAAMHSEFDSAAVLPPAATGALAEHLVQAKFGENPTVEQKAEAPELVRQVLDQWITQALENEANRAFTEMPRVVMAPHVDYPRGWLNYASVWGRMKGIGRPDRIVILGTNHFGMGTGVTGCDKSYESPLGVCPIDAKFVSALTQRLGPEGSKKLFENRYDHEREHSIELQIPWIQHCLGADASGAYTPVFGALVHDPSVNNGESYDGQGLGLDGFVTALRGAIEDVGGRTLLVSSADLSHVGPMFGDQQNLAGDTPQVQEARNKVLQHDQEMLKHVGENRPDDLVSAMSWLQNPTRWCSTGNIVAAMKAGRPGRVELLKYMAALDQQGMGMVTSAGAAMW